LETLRVSNLAKGTENKENRDKQQEAIIMKNKISFAELMQQNGFQHLGKTTYDGRFIYEREWRKTTDLAWCGEKESTYRIEGYESYGTPIIRLYENGRPLGMRDYSSPKRAINAIREILRCAGYTM